MDAVEYTTLIWVDWFNSRILLGPIGRNPPAEAVANYYAALKETAIAVRPQPNCFRGYRGDSTRFPNQVSGAQFPFAGATFAGIKNFAAKILLNCSFGAFKYVITLETSTFRGGFGLKRIVFSGDKETYSLLQLRGWGDFEEGFFWSVSKACEIEITPTEGVRELITGLLIEVNPFLSEGAVGGQSVATYVNGRRLASHFFREAYGLIDLEFEQPLHSDRPLNIQFDFLNAVSPKSVGVSEDNRMLAVQVLSITLIVQSYEKEIDDDI
jgi:hypothetical protein